MGRVRRDAAAGGRGRLCAGGRRLLRSGSGDHRAVLPAQKQKNQKKDRKRHEQEGKAGQAEPTRTGGEKPMKNEYSVSSDKIPTLTDIPSGLGR